MDPPFRFSNVFFFSTFAKIRPLEFVFKSLHIFIFSCQKLSSENSGDYRFDFLAIAER